jgi:hypothetical protein
MSESPEARTRRRWINLGELIAVAALIVSAAGVWVGWKNSDSKPDDGPRQVVEQKQSIPLILRGHAEDDGRRLAITPIESSHALDSLKITLPDGSTVETGSDGELAASGVEAALRARDKNLKGSHWVPVRIEARYVELGKDRTASGSYTLRYRWDGGGLFGGPSVRLTGLSR